MFIQNTEFMDAFNKTHKRSMLTMDRLLALWNLTKYANSMQGDIAEIGCRHGGTTHLMSLASKYKTLHAFDSFIGLPDPTSKDGNTDGVISNSLVKGRLAVDREATIEYLRTISGVNVYPGWIEDTLVNVKDIKFSLVYIDIDMYASTKLAIQFMWPRIVTGGYIIFDDYHWGATPGVTKAVDEFFGNVFHYHHYFIYPQLGIKKQ